MASIAIYLGRFLNGAIDFLGVVGVSGNIMGERDAKWVEEDLGCLVGKVGINFLIVD